MFSPIAIYFLYFVFSNPDNHLCFSQERQTSCTPQAPESVCAIYSGDSCPSSTSFCQKTITSPCLACSDPSIIAYIPGACKDSQTAKTCSNDVENISLDSEEENKVCGYSQAKRLGGQKILSQVYSDSSSACKTGAADFYVSGKCQEISSLNMCQKGQAIEEGCFGSSMPSCVYYAGEDCSEKLCRKTVENSCLSCADSSVLFYHEGSCEDRDPQIIRELEYLPDLQEFQPVGANSESVTIQLNNSERIEELLSRSDVTAVESNQDLPIPELEAVIQHDGSMIYEKVDHNENQNKSEKKVFLPDEIDKARANEEETIEFDLVNKRALNLNN